MNEMGLHRRLLPFPPMFARCVEMELLQLVFATRRRGEAAGRGVRLDCVPVVDDPECLRLPRYDRRIDLSPDSASQIDWRLLAPNRARRICAVRAPIPRIGVAPVRASCPRDASPMRRTPGRPQDRPGTVFARTPSCPLTKEQKNHPRQGRAVGVGQTPRQCQPGL